MTTRQKRHQSHEQTLDEDKYRSDDLNVSDSHTEHIADTEDEHVSQHVTQTRWLAEIPSTDADVDWRLSRNTRKSRWLTVVNALLLAPVFMVSLAVFLFMVVMVFVSMTTTADVIIAALALITLILSARIWSLSHRLRDLIERQSAIIERSQ